jgi:hypothetical protein
VVTAAILDGTLTGSEDAVLLARRLRHEPKTEAWVRREMQGTPVYSPPGSHQGHRRRRIVRVGAFLRRRDPNSAERAV